MRSTGLHFLHVANDIRGAPDLNMGWSMVPSSLLSLFVFFSAIPNSWGFPKAPKLLPREVCRDPNLYQQQLAFSSCGRQWIADKHVDIPICCGIARGKLRCCTMKGLAESKRTAARKLSSNRSNKPLTSCVFQHVYLVSCLKNIWTSMFLEVADFISWPKLTLTRLKGYEKLGVNRFLPKICTFSELLAARKIHHLDMAPGSTRRLRRETWRLQPVEFLKWLEMDLLCAKWWLNLKMIPFLGWKFVRTLFFEVEPSV